MPGTGKTTEVDVGGAGPICEELVTLWPGPVAELPAGSDQ